jgi:hypothetical protein
MWVNLGPGKLMTNSPPVPVRKAYVRRSHQLCIARFVRPGIEIVLRDGSSDVSVAFDREWGEEPDKRLHVVDEVNAAVQAHRARRG